MIDSIDLRRFLKVLSIGLAGPKDQLLVTGRKELFTRHALSITLFESLAQFDDATHQAIEGRRAHIGATASLLSSGAEIVRMVRVLDALNKVRFVADAELRAAWESASSVLAAPHFNAESEVKPAA